PELLLDRLEFPPEFAVRHSSSSPSASPAPPGDGKARYQRLSLTTFPPHPRCAPATGPHIVLRARLPPARSAHHSRSCDPPPRTGPDAPDPHRTGPGPDPGRPRPAGRGGTARASHGPARPAVHRGRVLPDPAATPVRRLRVRPAHVLAGNAGHLRRRSGHRLGAHARRPPRAHHRGVV